MTEEQCRARIKECMKNMPYAQLRMMEAFVDELLEHKEAPPAMTSGQGITNLAEGS